MVKEVFTSTLKGKTMTRCPKCNFQFMKSKVGHQSDICYKCYPVYRRAVVLYYAAKQRAEKRKLEFDLTVDWVYERLLRKYCPVTNLPFEFRLKGKNYNDRHALTPSIDKIDPTKGYTQDNCRVVIWWFNAAKQRYTDWDIWHLCTMVVHSLNVFNVPNVKKTEETEVKTT